MPLFTRISLLLLILTQTAFLFGQEPAKQWNYETFSRSHPDQVCKIRSSQSGKDQLEPALDFKLMGDNQAGNSAELRTRIRAAWRDLIGPSARNSGPLQPKVLEEQDFPRFVRKKVEYTGDSGERIRAWLFVPKGLRQKAPAMLCLHQTVQSGKDQCAGVAELKPELAFGPLLAERGFVTLCGQVSGDGGQRYDRGWGSVEKEESPLAGRVG